MQRSADEWSERACPVCGAHALALDIPPRIDVMGVQPYTDVIGMGDRPQQGPVGIVCRSCDTYWSDLAAFERGEPEPEVDEAFAPSAEEEPEEPEEPERFSR